MFGPKGDLKDPIDDGPGSLPAMKRDSEWPGSGAQANPLAEWSVMGKSMLERDTTGENSILVNYKRLEDGRDLSQNVVLRPGDTIVVP